MMLNFIIVFIFLNRIKSLVLNNGKKLNMISLLAHDQFEDYIPQMLLIGNQLSDNNSMNSKKLGDNLLKINGWVRNVMSSPLKLHLMDHYILSYYYPKSEKVNLDS